MTQSVELLLDPVADAAVRQEWLALRSAGLPSEQRSQPSDSHRPHVTLFAGDTVSDEMNTALSGVVRDMLLPLSVGALLLFGPHRERYVLAHLVVPSAELVELQRRVAEICRAHPGGYFAAGRWTPHITVARRLLRADLGTALDVLAGCSAVGQPLTVGRCRRWDSVARRTWTL